MIWHILKRAEWEEALRQRTYAPPSLQTEGFVHCSTASQTIGTFERFFRGQKDLVLLGIDEYKLVPELRWETPANPTDERAQEVFPHIYGPVNLDAVAEVSDFNP
jgi:uncharacterized protein (DUF952 family)